MSGRRSLVAGSGERRGAGGLCGAGVSLPQEFLDFRDTIRQIAQERIAPRAAEIDAKAEYPWDVRALLGENDILALPFAAVIKIVLREAGSPRRRRMALLRDTPQPEAPPEPDLTPTT